MAKELMTELDILGEKLAAKERLEGLCGFGRDKILRGKILAMESLEDLLKRDKEREKDGFKPKIRFRRILAGPNKVIVVPYIEEEQFVHGEFEPKKLVNLTNASDEKEKDIGETVGSGEGEVGDIIGETPLRGSGDDGDGDGDEDGHDPDSGAGQDPGDHGLEEEAYEAGKKRTEQLQLPNIKEKRKKVPTDEYVYDLTDRHKGSGQFLDKKETLKRVIRTNLILGRIDKYNLDPSKMIVSSQDKVYRVLSRERVWKSQAVVFFLRDYSGSMWGDPTKALISQHMDIYGWLLVQYERMVVPRFIVHDTEAREVVARQYFQLDSGGGTSIISGYKKINEIVESESLDKDFNIYVFQGTDGDDWERDGRRTLPELEKILEYANRMGVTVFKHPYYIAQNRKTTFEEYIEKGGILQKRDVFRMHVMPSENVTEEMNIEAIRNLVAQD